MVTFRIDTVLLQPKDSVLLTLTLSASKHDRSLKGLGSVAGWGNRRTDSCNLQIGLRGGNAVHSKSETSIICSQRIHSNASQLKVHLELAGRRKRRLLCPTLRQRCDMSQMNLKTRQQITRSIFKPETYTTRNRTADHYMATFGPQVC
jgi:hypothetical protein